MDLCKICEALKIEGTALMDASVKIIAIPKREILFDGKVKDIPESVSKRGWLVIEVLRDREFLKENPETPEYNLPYIITVM